MHTTCMLKLQSFRVHVNTQKTAKDNFCVCVDFLDLKMTKTNHKRNIDPNPYPNTRQTLILG